MKPSGYPIDDRRRKKRGRVYVVLGLIVGTVLIICSYSYVHGHVRIIRLDRIFNPTYGFPEGYRETYFARVFPSSQAINEYLTDATILFSQPPNGNEIFYFNHEQQFVSWRGNIVSGGTWRLSPSLQIIELDGKWRTAIVQRFCTLMSEMPANAQQDNCYDVSDIESILSRGLGSRREYKKGNVFDISANKPAPFQLPDSAITFDSLMSALAGKSR